jgi:hypothetical protein
MANHSRAETEQREGGRKGLERQTAFHKQSNPRFISRWPARAAPGFPPAIEFFEVARNDGLLGAWPVCAVSGAKTLADFTSVRPSSIIFFCSRSVFRGQRTAHDFGTAPEKTRLRTRIDSVASVAGTVT